MLYLIQNYHRIFFINIPRSSQEETDYLYPILETIKDGKFMSLKYKPRQIKLEYIPHVIIFANF